MKRVRAALLAALLLVAACGSSQSSDLKTVADAVAAADSQGMGFNVTLTILFTGGTIPKGRAEQVKAQGTGVARDARAALRYDFLGSDGKPSSRWDLVLDDSDLYSRPYSTSQPWRTAPTASVTALFPGLRLNLIRDSILLASKESGGGITHVNEGFAHQYTVTPAADQLEQLQAMNLQGQGPLETAFLKTATGAIDVYLGLSGNQLLRIDVHLNGTDPQTGTVQKDDFTISFRSAKVKPIPVPSTATNVLPSDLFAKTPSTG